jgi:hypothetical protein
VRQELNREDFLVTTSRRGRRTLVGGFPRGRGPPSETQAALEEVPAPPDCFGGPDLETWTTAVGWMRSVLRLLAGV